MRNEIGDGEGIRDGGKDGRQRAEGWMMLQESAERREFWTSLTFVQPSPW